MTLTAEQKHLRQTGITATDLPAILGKHPFRRPIDVYLSKFEEVKEDDEDQNERIRWGFILEPVLLSDYGDRHQCRVLHVGTLRHPEHEIILATPDGVALEGKTWARIVEIKTHSVYAARYGEPGTDEVPVHEWLQVAQNLAVTNLDDGDLVAFFDGLPREYHIERDRDLESDLLEVADSFWRKHILTETPPPPDGSKHYAKFLDKIENKLEDLIEPAEPLRRKLDELRETRRQQNTLRDRFERLKQQIQVQIGPHAGVKTPDGPLYWKRNKPSITTDFRAVANEYRSLLVSLGKEDAQLNQIVKDCTAEKDGARPFRLPTAWNKETK